eukprot:GDKJ01057604.1.p1 GENE.GDKJ01057604.1~~GDKJ01057604.1.p1  ORF type:complete len:208 (-),score=40.73 GDKJ01057604.1:75-635(-)
MTFVEPSFPEFTVKDRHGAEAYAKVTNDCFLNVAKKNKGGPVAFVDDKTLKMITTFYGTLLSGPDMTPETVEKVLAIIRKSRADRKKDEAAAKTVAAAAPSNKHANNTFGRESKFETGKTGAVDENDFEDYAEDEEWDEEEEEETEAVQQVSAAEVLKQQEAAKKAAAAAFVMPKKAGGSKTLVLK